MVPSHFSFNANIGGQSKPIKDKETRYLTDKQAKHMSKR